MKRRQTISEKDKKFIHDFYHKDFRNDHFERLRSLIYRTGGKSEVEDIFKEIWNTEKGIEAEDWEFENRLNRLHRSINLLENRHNKNSVRKIYSSFRKIAAVLLIPLLALSIYLSAQIIDLTRYGFGKAMVEIRANSGSKTSFSLPDGTKGWLNSNSLISYQMGFLGGREVHLEGEAYFDVAHKKRDPFYVHTEDAIIEVLGTKFDLINYPSEEKVEVILSEGLIKFKTKDASKERIIKPNQLLSYNKVDKELSIRNVDAFHYTSWTQGVLILRDMSMAGLLERMRRWYDVDIEVVDEQLNDYKFWGVFYNESIESILDLLKITSPLDYNVIPRKLQDDNSFSKKKIKLYYDKNWKPKTLKP